MDNETNKKSMKERWGRFKEEAHWKKLEAQNWVKENKDVLLTLTIVLGPAALRYAQSRVVTKRRSDEDTRQKRSVYDPVHHHSYECKRNLKPYEWAEIDRRKENGESVYDILMSMRLL